MTAVERRMTPWVDVVGELLSQPTTTFPRHVVADELARTFGTQVSWNWLDPFGAPAFELRSPIPGWPTPEGSSLMVEVVAHHPLLR